MPQVMQPDQRELVLPDRLTAAGDAAGELARDVLAVAVGTFEVTDVPSGQAGQGRAERDPLADSRAAMYSGPVSAAGPENAG